MRNILSRSSTFLIPYCSSSLLLLPKRDLSILKSPVRQKRLSHPHFCREEIINSIKFTDRIVNKCHGTRNIKTGIKTFWCLLVTVLLKFVLLDFVIIVINGFPRNFKSYIHKGPIFFWPKLINFWDYVTEGNSIKLCVYKITQFTNKTHSNSINVVNKEWYWAYNGGVYSFEFKST